MIRHVHGRNATLNDNPFVLLQQQCQRSCHSFEIRRWETIKAYRILDEKPPKKNTSKSSGGRCRNINHINPGIKIKLKNHGLPDRKQSKRRRDKQESSLFILMTKRTTQTGPHLGAFKKQMREVAIGYVISVHPSVRQRKLDTHPVPSQVPL